MRLPRPNKTGLAMTEGDERYKGIMRLLHFLRKFAMTEGWIPAFAGMTEGRNNLINYFGHKKKNNKIRCSGSFILFL